MVGKTSLLQVPSLPGLYLRQCSIMGWLLNSWIGVRKRYTPPSRSQLAANGISANVVRFLSYLLLSSIRINLKPHRVFKFGAAGCHQLMTYRDHVNWWLQHIGSHWPIRGPSARMLEVSKKTTSLA